MVILEAVGQVAREPMDARSYAGVSEEEFAIFLHAYRELCSKAPWIHVSLYADTFAKDVLFSRWLETLSGRPFVPLALTAAGLPLCIYFVITFFRLPPPVTPRTFRRLLLFAMTWSATGTLVLVVVALVAGAHVATRATDLNVFLFVTVRISLFVLPILLKHHNKLKQLEGKILPSRIHEMAPQPISAWSGRSGPARAPGAIRPHSSRAV